jgi:hypothetical protein
VVCGDGHSTGDAGWRCSMVMWVLGGAEQGCGTGSGEVT